MEHLAHGGEHLDTVREEEGDESPRVSEATSSEDLPSPVLSPGNTSSLHKAPQQEHGRAGGRTSDSGRTALLSASLEGPSDNVADTLAAAEQAWADEHAAALARLCARHEQAIAAERAQCAAQLHARDVAAARALASADRAAASLRDELTAAREALAASVDARTRELEASVPLHTHQNALISLELRLQAREHAHEETLRAQRADMDDELTRARATLTAATARADSATEDAQRAAALALVKEVARVQDVFAAQWAEREAGFRAAWHTREADVAAELTTKLQAAAAAHAATREAAAAELEATRVSLTSEITRLRTELDGERDAHTALRAQHATVSAAYERVREATRTTLVTAATGGSATGSAAGAGASPRASLALARIASRKSMFLGPSSSSPGALLRSPSGASTSFGLHPVAESKRHSQTSASSGFGQPALLRAASAASVTGSATSRGSFMMSPRALEVVQSHANMRQAVDAVEEEVQEQLTREEEERAAPEAALLVSVVPSAGLPPAPPPRASRVPPPPPPGVSRAPLAERRRSVDALEPREPGDTVVSDLERIAAEPSVPPDETGVDAYDDLGPAVSEAGDSDDEDAESEESHVHEANALHEQVTLLLETVADEHEMCMSLTRSLEDETAAHNATRSQLEETRVALAHAESAVADLTAAVTSSRAEAGGLGARLADLTNAHEALTHGLDACRTVCEQLQEQRNTALARLDELEPLVRTCAHMRAQMCTLVCALARAETTRVVEPYMSSAARAILAPGADERSTSERPVGAAQAPSSSGAAAAYIHGSSAAPAAATTHIPGDVATSSAFPHEYADVLRALTRMYTLAGVDGAADSAASRPSDDDADLKRVCADVERLCLDAEATARAAVRDAATAATRARSDVLASTPVGRDRSGALPPRPRIPEAVDAAMVPVAAARLEVDTAALQHPSQIAAAYTGVFTLLSHDAGAKDSEEPPVQLQPLEGSDAVIFSHRACVAARAFLMYMHACARMCGLTPACETVALLSHCFESVMKDLHVAVAPPHAHVYVRPAQDSAAWTRPLTPAVMNTREDSLQLTAVGDALVRTPARAAETAAELMRALAHTRASAMEAEKRHAHALARAVQTAEVARAQEETIRALVAAHSDCTQRLRERARAHEEACTRADTAEMELKMRGGEAVELLQRVRAMERERQEAAQQWAAAASEFHTRVRAVDAWLRSRAQAAAAATVSVVPAPTATPPPAAAPAAPPPAAVPPPRPASPSVVAAPPPSMVAAPPPARPMISSPLSPPRPPAAPAAPSPRPSPSPPAAPPAAPSPVVRTTPPAPTSATPELGDAATASVPPPPAPTSPHPPPAPQLAPAPPPVVVAPPLRSHAVVAPPPPVVVAAVPPQQAPPPPVVVAAVPPPQAPPPPVVVAAAPPQAPPAVIAVTPATVTAEPSTTTSVEPVAHSVPASVSVISAPLTLAPTPAAAPEVVSAPVPAAAAGALRPLDTASPSRASPSPRRMPPPVPGLSNELSSPHSSMASSPGPLSPSEGGTESTTAAVDAFLSHMTARAHTHTSAYTSFAASGAHRSSPLRPHSRTYSTSAAAAAHPLFAAAFARPSTVVPGMDPVPSPRTGTQPSNVRTRAPSWR